jgi:hypothetical protein
MYKGETVAVPEDILYSNILFDRLLAQEAVNAVKDIDKNIAEGTNSVTVSKEIDETLDLLNKNNMHLKKNAWNFVLEDLRKSKPFPSWDQVNGYTVFSDETYLYRRFLLYEVAYFALMARFRENVTEKPRPIHYNDIVKNNSIDMEVISKLQRKANDIIKNIDKGRLKHADAQELQDMADSGKNAGKDRVDHDVIVFKKIRKDDLPVTKNKKVVSSENFIEKREKSFASASKRAFVPSARGSIIDTNRIVNTAIGIRLNKKPEVLKPFTVKKVLQHPATIRAMFITDISGSMSNYNKLYSGKLWRSLFSVKANNKLILKTACFSDGLMQFEPVYGKYPYSFRIQSGTDPFGSNNRLAWKALFKSNAPLNYILFLSDFEFDAPVCAGGCISCYDVVKYIETHSHIRNMEQYNRAVIPLAYSVAKSIEVSAGIKLQPFTRIVPLVADKSYINIVEEIIQNIGSDKVGVKVSFINHLQKNGDGIEIER